MLPLITHPLGVPVAVAVAVGLAVALGVAVGEPPPPVVPLTR